MAMGPTLVVLLLAILACFPPPVSLAKSKFTGLKNAVTVSDLKEWKKLLKTRNNVLALFANGKKDVADILPVFEMVASNTRGKGSLIFIDCSAEAKKMCKNLKVKPRPYALKHYKDGAFHKDYDRLMEEKSMLSFMGNPAADPPWSEDPTASDVRHVEGPKDLENLLRTEKKPVLMFFYAPWCGHCKRMKPEVAAAAMEVKGQYVLAGMDVDTPDAFGVREQYNITGFPTIVYFEHGQRKLDYAGMWCVCVAAVAGMWWCVAGMWWCVYVYVVSVWQVCGGVCLCMWWRVCVWQVCGHVCLCMWWCVSVCDWKLCSCCV